MLSCLGYYLQWVRWKFVRQIGTSEFEFDFIGVLRHMQRDFSHIRDGTDVQADCRRNCNYGRAPNAIDISQGSVMCQSYTDTGPTFLYGDSDTPLL